MSPNGSGGRRCVEWVVRECEYSGWGRASIFNISKIIIIIIMGIIMYELKAKSLRYDTLVLLHFHHALQVCNTRWAQRVCMYSCRHLCYLIHKVQFGILLHNL